MESRSAFLFPRIDYATPSLLPKLENMDRLSLLPRSVVRLTDYVLYREYLNVSGLANALDLRRASRPLRQAVKEKADSFFPRAAYPNTGQLSTRD